MSSPVSVPDLSEVDSQEQHSLSTDDSLKKTKSERQVNLPLGSGIPDSTVGAVMFRSSSQTQQGGVEEKKEDESIMNPTDYNGQDPAKDENDSSRPNPTQMIPLISLQQGLARKKTATSLASWIALALTLDGRDKITKILQYSARFLAWWWAGTKKHARFEALKASLTTSRKAFRLGRSVIELHRLYSMGLLEAMGYHLEHQLSGGEEHGPKLIRRASTNIAWGPVTLEESERRESTSRRLLRSLSSVTYLMYRPMASRLSISEPDVPLWQMFGTAIKLLGLCGFWAADNMSYLTGSGFFDDLSVDHRTRQVKRKQWQSDASVVANRSYFIGALAGLYVSLRSYLEHRSTKMRPLYDQLQQAQEEDEIEAVERSIEKAREKQFILFVALLKSCCDVLVFSNNPGIDLWKKKAGFKLNEGLHCLLGLVSATTVLYNNFPNAK